MAEVAGGRATRLYSTRYVATDAGRRTATEKCRERRRRRIQLRRNAALGAAAAADGVDGGEGSNVVMGFPVQPPAGFPLAAPHGNGGGVFIPEAMHEQGDAGAPAAAGVLMLMPAPAPMPDVDVNVPPGNAVPVIGAVAVAGRQREMEDAVTIKTELCSPAINGFRPVHYLGVFDGHGGPHFAEMCKQNMHGMLEEELERISNMEQISNPWSPPPPPELIADESLLQEAWRMVMIRSFTRTELLALHTCACGSVGFVCKCERSKGVAYSGTTALVVVLTDRHIAVGNCGDSRAVLYRGGRVVPLSFDHKPDRADERARIQSIGGRIIDSDTARVQGILAMSRAIGDRYLKPYVISEPEVTFTRRDEEDEFLIIATDGLWDVIPTKFAGRVVRHCLVDSKKAAVGGGGGGGSHQDPGFAAVVQNEGHEGGGGGTTVSPSRSACAAALLTRLALARRSEDNVSVVVIDLKRTVMGGGDDN